MNNPRRPEFTSRGIARIFRWTLYPSLLPAVACSALFLGVVVHDFGPLTNSEETDVVIFTVGVILVLSLLAAVLAAGADALSLGRIPWPNWQVYWWSCLAFFSVPLIMIGGLLIWRASQGGLDIMVDAIISGGTLIPLLFLGTISLWSLAMIVLSLVGLFSNEQATLISNRTQNLEGQP